MQTCERPGTNRDEPGVAESAGAAAQLGWLQAGAQLRTGHLKRPDCTKEAAVGISGESVLGRGQSKCKGPGAGDGSWQEQTGPVSEALESGKPGEAGIPAGPRGPDRGWAFGAGRWGRWGDGDVQGPGMERAAGCTGVLWFNFQQPFLHWGGCQVCLQGKLLICLGRYVNGPFVSKRKIPGLSLDRNQNRVKVPSPPHPPPPARRRHSGSKAIR